MDDDRALQAIDAAFANVPRPTKFLRDPAHCAECAEHEALLRAATPASMSFAKFGNPGWDPVVFLQCDGLAYFMPGIVRMALCRGSNRDYVAQFCAHMNAVRMECFTLQQQAAMASFLAYFLESRESDIRAQFESRQLVAGLEQCISALAGG